jgi:hypothetical protein
MLIQIAAHVKGLFKKIFKDLRSDLNDYYEVVALDIDQKSTSQAHEKGSEAFAVLPDFEDRVSRREAFRAFLLGGVGILGDWVAGKGVDATVDTIGYAYKEVESAIAGEKRRVSSEAIDLIERARRSGRFAEEVISGFSEDEKSLCKIMFGLDRGKFLGPEETKFLIDLCNHRHDSNVRAFSAVQLSTNFGRCGLDGMASKFAEIDVNLDNLHKWRRFSLLVQRTNVRSMSSPYDEPSFDPEKSSCMTSIIEFERVCEQDIGAKLDEIYELNDTNLSVLLSEFGPPLVHMVFFNRFLKTLNGNLKNEDRRLLWRQQCEFYSRCLSPRVAGAVRARRAVWNHHLLIALQAHRFEDYDQRDFFIRSAYGAEGSLFKDTAVSEDLAERFQSRDPNYILFVLFLNTLGLREAKLDLASRVRSDLDYLIEHRSSIPSQPIRVALDTFRKQAKCQLAPEDAVNDYLFKGEMYRGYILDVPFVR